MKNTKNDNRGFIWWLCVGWWWIPVKWLCFKLPYLAIKYIVIFLVSFVKGFFSSSQSPTSHTPISVSEDSLRLEELPDTVLGKPLAYQYTNEICFIKGQKDTEQNMKYASSHIGNQINFTKEPSNKFDSHAVAIYLNDKKVGYVYKGKNQDMINDWLSKGNPIVAYISRCLDDGTVFYEIGFYK